MLNTRYRVESGHHETARYGGYETQPVIQGIGRSYVNVYDNTLEALWARIEGHRDGARAIKSYQLPCMALLGYVTS